MIEFVHRLAQRARRARFAALGLALCLGLTLAGCDGKPAFRNTDVTGVDFGGDFALTGHDGKARTLAQALATALVRASEGRSLRVLGPAPAPISRIKNRYRWQVLVKARSRPDARDVLDLALARLGDAHAALRALTVEVDPVNLM